MAFIPGSGRAGNLGEGERSSRARKHAATPAQVAIAFCCDAHR